MAKEVAVGKRATISEAQQSILLAVLGASVLLGVAVSLTSHFVKQIMFNADVISAEDEALVNYSTVIKNTGVCLSPKGSVYTDEELNNCTPENISVSQIPGTLRANVLTTMAGNEALNSVPNDSNSDCQNPVTGQQFTYAELESIYNEADKSDSSEQLSQASQLIKSCSALRVIPDALPAFKNEEALLASLNKLFIVSNWTPENLSPAGSMSISNLFPGLNVLSVNVSVEADSGTTMNVLNNIERSIREFDFKKASIEWDSDNTLHLEAEAAAYYMDESSIVETTTTKSAEGN